MRKIPLQIKEPNLQPLRQFNMTFQINALESPPPHSYVSLTLVFIQCFCPNYSCDRVDRFGWVGNTKHGTTNISSSLYIQHMALWILPPFARINFSSLIRATWRDLVMFPAVFHCCQPVMNENSDNASAHNCDDNADERIYENKSRWKGKFPSQTKRKLDPQSLHPTDIVFVRGRKHCKKVHLLPSVNSLWGQR